MITPAPTDNTSNIDQLTDIDSLNPHNRLDALLMHESAYTKHQTEQILLGLCCIDAVVESTFGVSSLYLVQNNAFEQLFLDMVDEAIQPEEFVHSLVLLDEADLIFRFTCAQKFAIRDESLKQLRINSWGKSYIRERHLIQEFSSFTDEINRAASKELTAHAETYNTLVTQLQETVTPLQATIIGKLNNSLNLKLLS